MIRIGGVQTEDNLRSLRERETHDITGEIQEIHLGGDDKTRAVQGADAAATLGRSGINRRRLERATGLSVQKASFSPNLGGSPEEAVEKKVRPRDPPTEDMPGANPPAYDTYGWPDPPGTEDNMPNIEPEWPEIPPTPGEKPAGFGGDTGSGGTTGVGGDQSNDGGSGYQTRDPTKDPDYSDGIKDKDTPHNQDDGESSAESRADRERETRDPTDDPGYSDNISGKDTPSW